MEFKSLKKIHDGHFIHRYDITYETVDGKEKVYEMISRNPDISTLSELQAKTPDSVVLIMHDEKNEKILLNKEFRLALGDWVYNFPAGLIDEGEEPIESARRELKEETGLDLLTVNDILPLSYSAIGFANETNLCIVGVADGTFSKSSSTVEEIKAGWYTKDEVKKLLNYSPQEHSLTVTCGANKKMLRRLKS